ncbi:gamma-glutamylcyclotransferase [Shewanella sp. 202IG2-18]|nr:gamma-glutamylcyclotransferase [Parashewanella hymeniacidonis]
MTGYERRFFLEMLLFRGSESNPGVMMALDEGSFCDGVALQIEKQDIELETKELWAREYALGGYIPIISKVECKNTHRSFTCITFVINHQSNRYHPSFRTNPNSEANFSSKRRTWQ